MLGGQGLGGGIGTGMVGDDRISGFPIAKAVGYLGVVSGIGRVR